MRVLLVLLLLQQLPDDIVAKVRSWSQVATTEVEPHLMLAATFNKVGLGEAARDEARTAVWLAPNKAEAHFLLADIVARDDYGRWLGPGSDARGAIAELRKAKAIDPKYKVARLELARLLAYTKGDAEAEYRAIRKDFGDGDASLEEAAVLVRVGRPLDALAVIDAAKSVTPSEGARAALAVVASMGNRDEVRRRVALLPAALRKGTLREASRLLYSERLYPGAVLLLEEAVAEGSDDAKWLAALRKFERHEKRLAPADDPLGFAQRKLVRALLDCSGDAYVRALWPVRANQPQMPPEVWVDYFFATTRFDKEGDDRYGWRVRFETAGGGTARGALYVRKERGEWHLLTTSDHPAELALRARAAADAADTQAAQRWLDWSYSDTANEKDSDPLASQRAWPAGEGQVSFDVPIAVQLAGDPAHAAEAIPALSQCKRTECEAARFTAYFGLHRLREALPIAERLAHQFPDSARAFRWQALTLYQLGAAPQLRLLASQRLRAHPDDVDATAWLAHALQLAGDSAGGERELKRLADAGSSNSEVYNLLAWLALFRRTATADDVAMARKAVELTHRRNRNVLNTLAAVLADSGRVAEAHDVLVESWPAIGQNGPYRGDFYVLGRIAEQLGRRVEAAAFYRQESAPPAGVHPGLSAYVLAQKRLAALH